MSKLPGYGDTVICPYNKCVIMRSRIQTHLIKCARSHPNIKLEMCPFDATHRFTEEDMKAHVEECPSRENFDRYVYRVGNAPNFAPPVQPTPRPKPPPPKPDEENWDHYDTPTYDPQKYAMNARVFRASTLMTPSERRKFADSERK